LAFATRLGHGLACQTGSQHRGESYAKISFSSVCHELTTSQLIRFIKIRFHKFVGWVDLLTINVGYGTKINSRELIKAETMLR